MTVAYTSNQGMRAVEEWTAEDEGTLQSLKCFKINLGDTAFGRQQALQQQYFRAAGVNMPDNQFNQIIKLQKRKRKENDADLLGVYTVINIYSGLLYLNNNA